MENESQWICHTHHIHHAKSNVSPVHINNVQLSQTEVVRYLGLHVDRRLT
jgi:hypothetical protein